jgi:hypothetical protein
MIKNDTLFFEETITGIVDFARVHEPKAKYGKEGSKSLANQEYTISLRVDNENTLKQFNDIVAKYKFSPTVYNPKTREEVPRVRARTDKKTGAVGPLSVQFKRGAEDKNGGLRELAVVDRQAKPLPKTTLIGNGSTVAIKLLITVDKQTNEPKSMLLNGVQVLNLSKPTGPKFEVLDEDIQETQQLSSQSSPF